MGEGDDDNELCSACPHVYVSLSLSICLPANRFDWAGD